METFWPSLPANIDGVASTVQPLWLAGRVLLVGLLELDRGSRQCRSGAAAGYGGSGLPLPWSEAWQVYRYQPFRQGVDGEGGFLQGNHAQQAGLSLFCEYDRCRKLQSLQPYGGPADVDWDDPAVGRLRGE